MAIDLVETLCDLVAIPSVNPMGRDVSGPEFLEHRMTEHLAALFERMGLRYERHTVEPRRDNIIARLDGAVPVEQGGELLLFEAHQDTVPVDGMTIDPWKPVVRDRRIYGRGACDIKGGMSAMLAAISRLADEPPDARPTIVMACTVNEEHGYSGAVALANLWQQGGSSLLSRTPDAAIVAEPTDLNVVVAHKGAVRWRCRTRGRAAHSSKPETGDNAVYKMSRVLAALEAYQHDVAPNIEPHPLCGGATLSVGTIRGGLSVNTVPDECTIEIDRRLLPGEDNQAAYRHVVDHIASWPGIDFAVEHDSPFMDGATLSDGPNHALAKRLCEVAQVCGFPSKPIGVPYGTDASKISAAGVPAVVFGPGSIDQAHTVDEWLPLDELSLASEILYRLGRAGLKAASS